MVEMMRVRTTTALLMLLVLGLAFAPNAAAQTNPTTTAPEAAVDIGGGNRFTSAVITTPGEPAPRTFSAYQAATFVQSWLAYALFGQKPTVQDPPPTLPVSRVDVRGQWGDGTTPGTVTVYYASDGTTAWISFPDQDASPEPYTPPPPSHWFVAPPRVIQAFNGTATLADTLGTETATQQPKVGERPSGSGGSMVPWLVLLGGTLVVAVGAVFFIRRRRAAALDAALD
jgi:LPXTG-motif cell wall-anchored protein